MTNLSPEWAEADAYVEQYAEVCETLIGFGVGQIILDAWRDARRALLDLMATSCGCDKAGHHDWNCPLTPIWAQTIRDLDGPSLRAPMWELGL